MYSFNTSSFPIVYVTIYKSPQSCEDWDTRYKEWFTLYKHQRKMVYIIDLSRITSCEMKYITSLVDFSREMKKHTAWVSCTLFYFKSDILKNLFQLAIQIEYPIRPIIITKEQSVIQDVLQKQLYFTNVKDYTIYKPKDYSFDDVLRILSECIH